MTDRQTDGGGGRARGEHDQERYDRYAHELVERFDDLVQWAISHWPREDQPLMQSDFDAARREVSRLAGPQLGEPDKSKEVPDPPGLEPERKSGYRDMNPMPWP